MATVFIPNVFVAGTPAVATEVNQNFTAITNQVNGNLDATNLADGAVTNVKVATGIDAAKIANGSVSNAEFQYLDGVTSAIQTQLNAKQATITGGASTIASSNLTTNRAIVSDGSGKVGVSAVTSTELGHVAGVTSAIQTQLNGKLATTAGAVATANLADSAVTNVKIASGVDAAKLTTGTLPIARIADGAVTNVKIASGIDAAKLTTGTLPIARIANNAVTPVKTTFFPQGTSTVRFVFFTGISGGTSSDLDGNISLPSGWSNVTSAGVGRTQINHNIGHTNYTVFVTVPPQSVTTATWLGGLGSQTSSSFTINTTIYSEGQKGFFSVPFSCLVIIW